MIADKAIKWNIPQAPNLYFWASVGYLKREKPEEAKAVLSTGLVWLSEWKKWKKLKISADIKINKILNGVQNNLADFVQEWISENVPNEVRSSSAWLTATGHKAYSLQLPSNCGNSEIPSNPKEVDWFDASKAVCHFYGCIKCSS